MPVYRFRQMKPGGPLYEVPEVQIGSVRLKTRCAPHRGLSALRAGVARVAATARAAWGIESRSWWSAIGPNDRAKRHEWSRCFATRYAT